MDQAPQLCLDLTEAISRLCRRSRRTWVALGAVGAHSTSDVAMGAELGRVVVPVPVVDDHTGQMART